MCTKKTVLYDEHIRAGGKMVDFAGYQMPIQYPSGTIKEHNAVREGMGIFDVSHMGEILVEGEGASRFLDYLLTNVMSTLAEGRIRYGVMCRPDGGTIDDLIVYRLAKERFLLVVNAANRDKDVQWIQEQAGDDVKVTDVSDEYALIALQGPKSKALMANLVHADQLPKKYYSFVEDVEFLGKRVLLSRTGYTGEFGYEIYMRPEDAGEIWRKLLESGELTPCGLGARDTLRLEAGMCLYGHELSEAIKPTEADIDFALKLEREPFIGQDALLVEPEYTRIGLEAVGRGIMREGYRLFTGDKEIGVITSGTSSPYTKKSIAMARVKKNEDYENLFVDIRGKLVEVKHVEMPFNSK